MLKYEHRIVYPVEIFENGSNEDCFRVDERIQHLQTCPSKNVEESPRGTGK